MTRNGQTDPADDPALTVRVHPLDDPHKPGARRYLRTDDNDEDTRLGKPTPWDLVTGNDHDETPPIGVGHEYLVGWPVQYLDDLMKVMKHPDDRPTDGSRT